MSIKKSILEVRDRFLSEVQKDPGQFHPLDIERVRTEDWQVRRFLIEYDDNTDKAFKHLVKSMKWKKEFGIHSFKEDMWPREFYESAGAEVVGETNDGALVQWEVLRTQYDFNELHEFYKQCIATSVEKYDRIAGERGIVTVIDAANMGISNVSLDITKFKNQLREYYPCLCKGVYIVDHAWYLLPFSKMVVAVLSPSLRALIKYVSAEELRSFIDPKYIPKALKGQRENYVLPVNSESISSETMMATLNIDGKFVDKFFSTTKLQRATSGPNSS